VTRDISAASEVCDTLWLLGRDRDAQGNIIPGARPGVAPRHYGHARIYRRAAGNPRSVPALVKVLTMKGNRYLEAFKEQHNVIGLATAVAASLALMNPLPLLIGAVAEVAYLMFYADSRWYALRMAKKFDEEVEERRRQLKQQVFPVLGTDMQARFTRLEVMRQDIEKQSNEDASWYREVLRKLDFLLEKFLHFACKDAQFREYLQEVRDQIRADQQATQPIRPQLNAIKGGKNSSPQTLNQQPSPVAASTDEWVQATVQEIQAHYDGELNNLEQKAAHETDRITSAVLGKRIEVLKRRREFVGKIGRIQLNLHHQLQLLEDTFGLINDEIRARPPEQVLSDIEEVVSQTQTMTQLLDEVAPLESLLAS
jgi:hypothetical protein